MKHEAAVWVGGNIKSVGRNITGSAVHIKKKDGGAREENTAETKLVVGEGMCEKN